MRDEVTFSVLTYHASSPEGVGLKHKSKTGLLIWTIDEDVTNPLGGPRGTAGRQGHQRGGLPLVVAAAGGAGGGGGAAAAPHQ